MFGYLNEFLVKKEKKLMIMGEMGEKNQNGSSDSFWEV